MSTESRSEPPGESLETLTDDEVQARLQAIREQMRPLERELAEVRARRDVLLTELRRRERLEHRARRSGLKEAIRSGELETLAEVAGRLVEGRFDEFNYNLKTGGEVVLGFPGARSQTISWTDGRQVAQARDFAECLKFFEAGWEMGAPGRPGVRVHLKGTRLERLVEPSEVFVRPT